MEIYERIFTRLEELHMTQLELSRRTGIATSTICDWKKKKVNPQADKLVVLCKALEMSLVDLLCAEEDKNISILFEDCTVEDKLLIESIVHAPSIVKRRLLRYYELISIIENDSADGVQADYGRNVSVVQDVDGNNIVLINDIIFKGKRTVNWKDVREYLT